MFAFFLAILFFIFTQWSVDLKKKIEKQRLGESAT